MLQRGRKSAGANVIGLPVVRLEVPPELTDEQAQEYRAIAGSVPSDWFDAGSKPLLIAMCGHVTEERRLRKLLSEFDTECLKTPDGLRLYDLLTKNHERQSRAVVQLARQMRLTQQARYRADAAAVASDRSKRARPWEPAEDDES